MPPPIKAFVYNECHNIAARMLCHHGTPDVKNLNPHLCEFLAEIDALCATDGGSLKSRQVVAIIVLAWKHANPDWKAYR